MPSFNRIQLIGYLGKDPEVHTTGTGKKVAEFSLAVGRRWRTADGETHESTDWFNINAWGRLGEICSDYLRKGRLVFVEGRVQTDKYEHEGETRYFTHVVASNVQILDRRPEEDDLAPSVPDEELPA